MLPTDELIRKALTNTTTTNMAAIIPKLWAAQLENNLRRGAVLQQLITPNTDLLNTDGDVVYIPSLPDIAEADDLTEGTDMNIIALNNATSVPISPAEVGKAVSITRKALDRMKYDAMSEILDRLAYSMTRKREGTIAKLHTKTVPTLGGSLTKLYPNGHASGTVVVGDTFNLAFLENAILQMKLADNNPWPDGLWRVVLSNYQYLQLIQDPLVREDLHYSQPQAVLQGEVGILRQCRIIVTNWVDEVLEGAGGTVKVSAGYICAPRWAFYVPKRETELTVDPTLYDFGRRKQFGTTGDWAYELVHNERAMVLKTAHT
jgi:N4-gp56 family major capsid protein